MRGALAHRIAARPRPARRLRVRGDGQLPPTQCLAAARGRLRRAPGLIRGSGPHARGAAQRLGQERPQGCAGNPAHVADRHLAGLPRPARGRHQRRPGTVEDPRGDLERQDSVPAPEPDPLPAALLSRGGALPPQQPQRLVLRLPGPLPDSCQHHGFEQGSLHRSRLERGRTQSLQGTPARRHLRDGQDLDRAAHRSMHPLSACSGS